MNANRRRALITGITGQDGYYLTKLLLEKDYDVFGIIRRHSQHGTELGTVQEFQDEINFEYGDLLDRPSLEAALHRCLPHEVYNLAAQSHVRISFDMPQYTTSVNANGALNVLEATRRIVPHARFYQASTSEMFGNQVDADGFQRETTPMVPVSPYGAAKLFAHHMIGQYRRSGMFACSGILFNHESPKRGDNFVTKKITNYVRQFSNANRTGRANNKLTLGNLNARRDWGHAEDYVRGMWMMLQHEVPDDYVLATGKTHSIEDFLYFAFCFKGLYWQDWVVTDEQFFRPEDVHHLRGDSGKARRILGWHPSYSFDELVKDMIIS